MFEKLWSIVIVNDVLSLVITVLIDQVVPLLASSVLDWRVFSCRYITDSPYIAILTCIEKCTLNNHRNENQCYASCRLSVFIYSDVDCCRRSVANESTHWVLRYYTGSWSCHFVEECSVAILSAPSASFPLCQRIPFNCSILYWKSVSSALFCVRIRISIDAKVFWRVLQSIRCTYGLSCSIQGVTGGTDQISGECSLGQTIPI